MGIVLSMFSALVISRYLTLMLFMHLGSQETRNTIGEAKERKPIDFLGRRKICFIISIVLIVIGPVDHGYPVRNRKRRSELQPGVQGRYFHQCDLQRGYEPSLISIHKVKPVVQEVTGDADIQTQKVTGTNQVIIKTRTLDPGREKRSE